MKLLKKLTALVLVLCVAAGLGMTALAATANVSSQRVKVDGRAVTVQPYNINGYNYFKLRDVAALLTDTDSRFEVSYTLSNRRMLVATGKAYTSVGGELKAGGGGSVTGEKSNWTLSVDGKTVSCSIYNISGNNYFKLRDLGTAIGFAVDYDSKNDTVLITTADASAAAWEPDITFTTTDAAGGTVTDDCFKEAELTMVNYWAYWCGYCVQEMPDLQKLATNYASKGVQVIGIFDADSDYSDAKNLAVLKDLGITYSNIRYVPAFDGYLSTGYMPATIFVDGDGRVVGNVYAGARSYSQWTSIVESLL